MIAIYHRTKAGYMVAVSSDPLLLNWSKLSCRAVTFLKAEDGTALQHLVFDPCYLVEGWHVSLPVGRGKAGGNDASGNPGTQTAATPKQQLTEELLNPLH